MTRVAELWNGLTDDEQDNLARAWRGLRGGAELIGAIAKEARLYTSGSLALERAQAALQRDPFPALMPPEVAAPILDTPPRTGYPCDCCGDIVAKVYPLWDFDTSTLLMLGEQHWRDRMLHRGVPEVAGDQLQALPTSMPVQEAS